MSDVGDKLEKLPELSKQLQVPDALTQAAVDPGIRDTNDTTSDKAEVAAEQPSNHSAEVGWRPGRFRVGAPAGQTQGFSDRRTGRNRWVNDPRVIAQLELDPNFIRTNEAPSPDDPTKRSARHLGSKSAPSRPMWPS